MNKKESYCGLCNTCPLGNLDFLEALAKVKNYVGQLPLYWWAHCFPGNEGFSLPEFFKGLEWFLSQPECPGCKEGGGLDECPIRCCATHRQVAHCNQCAEVDTCERYQLLTKGFPGIKISLHRNFITTRL
jgi:hypothetical protein